MRMLTPKEKAAEIGVPTSTLEKWRAAGTGPEFKKFSPQVVRYFPDPDLAKREKELSDD